MDRSGLIDSWEMNGWMIVAWWFKWMGARMEKLNDGWLVFSKCILLDKQAHLPAIYVIWQLPIFSWPNPAVFFSPHPMSIFSFMNKIILRGEIYSKKKAWKNKAELNRIQIQGVSIQWPVFNKHSRAHLWRYRHAVCCKL